MEKKYYTDWIYEIETKLRWDLYWMQQMLIQKYAKPDETFIEIGPGTGFLSNYLKNRGFNILTLDLDPDKKPDIVADIVKYMFDKPVDNILAFEIFEHLEYAEFETVLGNLREACKHLLFVSLPINKYQIFRGIISFLKWNFDWGIYLPKNRLTAKYHHWEYNYRKYSGKFIIDTFGKYDFDLIFRKKTGKHIFLIFSNRSDKRGK